MKKFEVSDAIENLLGSIAILETMREVPETYDQVQFVTLALRSARLDRGDTWVDEEEEKYLVAYGDDLVNILEEWAREQEQGL